MSALTWGEHLRGTWRRECAITWYYLWTLPFRLLHVEIPFVRIVRRAHGPLPAGAKRCDPPFYRWEQSPVGNVWGLVTPRWWITVKLPTRSASY